ncbi:hypothetical protein [Pseudonocardia sp. NPDC049635]|uniref:hypothetical protein n=1 Tax=Pseudonocardia sp. NPDC049635 TaxID=3155506 RepID=UPI0034079369
MSRPDWLPSSTVTVDIYVYESTTFPVHLYPGEDRATVDLTGSGGTVTLFLPRADLTRLREVLAQAERDLTEQHQNRNRVREISGPAA